jgi:hypothetical protein
MERSYTTIDKTDWGDGPWQHESDKLQWVDEATGLDCLIVRNHFGALCGYVGVPPSHPDYGRDCDDVDVWVHGGLTYAASCQEDADEATSICHVVEPGRPDNIWWFGFDCGHAFDVMPGMDAAYKRFGVPSIRETLAIPGMKDSYRDVPYVRAECARLARQLNEVSPGQEGGGRMGTDQAGLGDGS